MEHNKQKGDEISFTNKAEKLNFGKTGLDILDVYLPLSNLTKTPLNPSLLSPHQIQEIGLEIRNEVEWTAWSDKTAFPPLKQNAAVGIALGQCLVKNCGQCGIYIGKLIGKGYRCQSCGGEYAGC